VLRATSEEAMQAAAIVLFIFASLFSFASGLPDRSVHCPLHVHGITLPPFGPMPWPVK
jgi:hypothetical protein